MSSYGFGLLMLVAAALYHGGGVMLFAAGVVLGVALCKVLA